MSENLPPSTDYSYNAFSGGQSPAAPAAAPVRPKQVEIAFWLLIASLVLSVISIPVGIAVLNSDDSRALMQSQFEGSGLTVDVDATISAATSVLIFMGIVSSAISLLVAIFIRKGHNWARILLTVFAVLSLLNLVDLSVGNLPAVAGTLLTVGATVLLYLAPSPAYFTAAKQYRQSKKFSQA